MEEVNEIVNILTGGTAQRRFDGDLHIRQAGVVSVDLSTTPTTLTVNVGGDTTTSVAGVRWIGDGYPAVGSRVYLFMQGRFIYAFVERTTLLGKVATTDATVTTIVTIPIPASTTFMAEARVVARRTGGASGSAEDGAGYGRAATFKGAAGTVAQIGATTAMWDHESVAGYDCTFSVTGATALLSVTGAATTNIAWTAVVTGTYSVSS